MGRKEAVYAPTPEGVKAAWDIYNQMVKIERARCLSIVQHELEASIEAEEPSRTSSRLANVKARIIAGKPR